MRARNAWREGQNSPAAAVDVVQTMRFELVTSVLGVADMHDPPHVRIRNADFLHAALNDDWCFEVVSGGANDAPERD